MATARLLHNLRHRVDVALAALWHEADRFRSGDPLIPPSRLHSVGLGSFREVGNHLLELLVERGGLQPQHRVLDVGCGTGRVARPLTAYLRTGSYEGLDIVRPSIEWCRSAYRGFPHFRFHHADIFNRAYNPGGQIMAADYRFPFEDGSFDFVLLTSVFTHMLADDTRHYLREIERLLAPGGRILLTAFLLDRASRHAIEAGRADFTFNYDWQDCYVERPDVPEAIVAYNHEVFAAMLEEAELAIRHSSPGTWRGGDGISYQDVLVVGSRSRSIGRVTG